MNKLATKTTESSSNGEYPTPPMVNGTLLWDPMARNFETPPSHTKPRVFKNTPEGIDEVVATIARYGLNKTSGEIPERRHSTCDTSRVITYTGRALTFTIVRTEPRGTVLVGTPQRTYPTPAARLEPIKIESSVSLLTKHNSVSKPFVEALDRILQITGLSKSDIGTFLGISRQAIYLWSTGQAEPTTQNLERLYAVRTIIDLAAERHNTVHAMRAWLNTPIGLEATTPAKLLQEGNLDKARLFAVVRPALKLALPSWINKPIPAKYQGLLERPRLTLPPERVLDTEQVSVPYNAPEYSDQRLR